MWKVTFTNNGCSHPVCEEQVTTTCSKMSRSRTSGKLDEDPALKGWLVWRETSYVSLTFFIALTKYLLTERKLRKKICIWADFTGVLSTMGGQAWQQAAGSHLGQSESRKRWLLVLAVFFFLSPIYSVQDPNAWMGMPAFKAVFSPQVTLTFTGDTFTNIPKIVSYWCPQHLRSWSSWPLKLAIPRRMKQKASKPKKLRQPA